MRTCVYCGRPGKHRRNIWLGRTWLCGRCCRAEDKARRSTETLWRCLRAASAIMLLLVVPLWACGCSPVPVVPLEEWSRQPRTSWVPERDEVRPVACDFRGRRK